MATLLRWTVLDLEVFPEPLDDTRYEIVDGELYVSKQPSWEHQTTCTEVVFALRSWNEQTKAGAVGIAPGIIFAEDEAVAPDVVWISKERLATALGEDRKLHSAPELVVEVLSPGVRNERRDRHVKLEAYSRRGVDEYWILDWQRRQVEVYRREHAALRLVATLRPPDALQSPLLPGLSVPVERLFAALP